jgi:elongation factor G
VPDSSYVYFYIGKTTTSEQMLFLGGQTKAIGRVDTGDTVMDFLPQERERGITISSSAISFQWKGKNINLIDT